MRTANNVKNEQWADSIANCTRKHPSNKASVLTPGLLNEIKFERRSTRYSVYLNAER